MSINYWARMQTGHKSSLIMNLGIGLPLFVTFASTDAWYTLKGLQGDLTLEANAIMRFMMEQFGLVGGLIIEKSLVLVVSLVVALVAAYGIEHEREWVYWLALTPMTKRWMRHKKRRFIAYLPIHLATLAQAIAAFSWVYLITRYGYIG
jgi:hypothetical protein